MGAMGGPCSGHLLVSQVPLMVGSAVGQMNSLPWSVQTGAMSPGQEDVFIKNAKLNKGNSTFLIIIFH